MGVSSRLVDDTLDLRSIDSALFVVVNELFCSSCLSQLDDFVAKNLPPQCTYRVIDVSGISKSYVNERVPTLARYVGDRQKLFFTRRSSLDLFLDFAKATAKWPILLRLKNKIVTQLNFDDLFSHDPDGNAILNTSIVCAFIKR